MANKAPESRLPTQQNAAMPVLSGKVFPIVALGASAGGLEALEEFFAHVSPETDAAVAQYLDPNHKALPFKRIPGDVGRPLSDIVTDLDYPELSSDVDDVLSTPAFFDRDVSRRDGRWYQVKIMPYHTMRNIIDGVVVTFSDISRAKSLEAELRARGDENRS